MTIESDRAHAMSGVRYGITTGGPIALVIPNKDWDNWQRTMAVESQPEPETPGVDRAAMQTWRER
jgi:chorismate synthase